LEKLTRRLKWTAVSAAGVLLALGGLATRVPPMAGSGPATGALQGAQDTLAVAELIRRSGNALVADETVKGLSIGFLDLDGERVVADFGVSEGGSAYRIASVSKIFLAMAVMQLVEEGRLRLDAPLSAILPSFTVRSRYPESEPITIRHLLTHTSGLSRDRIAGMQSYCPLDDRHLLSYLAGHYQALPAGYRHSYSNPGFELLGYAVEEASDRPFTDYVRERILEPLDLGSTTYVDQAPTALPRAGTFAPSHDDPVEEMPIRYTAAGGLTSSVPDLLRVLEMLLSGGRYGGRAVLDSASVAAMWSWQNREVALDTDVRLGLAWFLEDLPPPFEGRIVSHGGGSLYSNAMVMLVPEHGLGVVVLAGTAGSYPAVAGLARKVLLHALETKTGQQVEESTVSWPHPVPWSAAESARVHGRFVTATSVLDIDGEGAEPVVRTGGTTLPLRLFEDGSFTYADAFRLHIDSIGDEAILFMTNPAGTMPIGHGLTEYGPVPGAWASAQGEYHLTGTCPEGETVFYERIQVAVRDGYLRVVLHPGHQPRTLLGVPPMAYVLIPVDDQAATMAGFGRYPGETVYRRTTGAGTEEILFAGLRFVRESGVKPAPGPP